MADGCTRLFCAAVAITMLTGSGLVGDVVNIEYARTRIGDLQSIKLLDGSVITLNTDSAIKTRFDGDSLHIEVLRGEVLFAMKSNSQRHLVVSARDLTIFDAATTFDVRLDGSGQVRVTVQEGEVQLEGGRLAQMPLKHNQRALVDERAGHVELQKGLSSKAIERQLSWREGRLVFVCDRLSEVAREFNRYNLVKLEVDPRIGDEQIGGEFSTTDVEGFAELMPRVDATVRWERALNAQGVMVLKLYQAGDGSRAPRPYTQCGQ